MCASSADSATAHPPCPACAALMRPGSLFCPACGTYLDRGIRPAILEKMAASIVRARRFRYLGYALTPVVFSLMLGVLHFGFILFEMYGNKNIILHLTFLIIALISIGIYYYRTRLHSVLCPACGCRMPETVAAASCFCHHCGTRIRHSPEAIDFAGTSVRSDESSFCSICGKKVLPGDTFCAACGGNLGHGFFVPEDDNQDGESEFFRQRQICPGCGKRLQVIAQGIDKDFGYVRLNNYCARCGYCLTKETHGTEGS